MNNPHFTFPPPPPPPPQALGNYNGYQHDSSRQQGQNGRGRGGGRGQGGKGRGHGRGGQRGGHASGYSGYPSVNQRQTEGQYNQPSDFGGNYPLPDYPVVQQPQYPASVHNAYSHQPPPYSQQAPYPNHPPSSYSGYPANGHRAAPTYGTHDESSHYGQGPPAPRDSRRAPKRGPSNQPIIMPPIRVGRDGRGGILRTQATQSPPVQYDYGPPAHNMYQEAPPNNYQQNGYDQSQPRQFQNSRGRGHRRGQSDAIHQSHYPNTSRQVPPAVPSFGAPFPGDMSWRPPFQSASRESSNKPKKKKRRRHNQLGLTPKTEDHESSEEDDDQDEELKLAAAVGAASQLLEFTYKGQTSTLHSSSELAAWLAERKKRFPTKARAAEAAERKKQHEETQRLARQAAKDSQERRRAEARERQEEQKAEAKEKQDKQKAATKLKHDQPLKIEDDQKSVVDKDTAALKARLKVEKLRKRLEKEEKRIAKAEAKASRATEGLNIPTNPSSLADDVFQNRKRKRTDSLSEHEDVKVKSEESLIKAEPPQSPSAVNTLANETRPILSAKEEPKEIIATTTQPTGHIKQEPDTAQNPLTPTSQPSIPDTNHPDHSLDLSENHPPSAVPNLNGANDETIDDIDVSSGDSDSSLSEDSSDVSSSDEDNESTSSEGSSSSSDDAPETAPLKGDGPVRVPPPKRENPNAKNKNICRQFLKSGRCPRGEKCRFRHELPEKGSGSPVERKGKVSEPKKERKGLYQRLVEQEQEQDDQQALTAIIQLGEQGLLEPPTDGISGGN